MEGKVELPIERYEELTKIERDGFARVKELEANMDKIYVHYGDWLGVNAEYLTKDYAMNALHEKLSYITREYERYTNGEDAVKLGLKTEIQKYKEASFGKRFKYLWTGEM